MDTNSTPQPRYISADEWKRLHAAPAPEADPAQLTIDQLLALDQQLLACTSCGEQTGEGSGVDDSFVGDACTSCGDGRMVPAPDDAVCVACGLASPVEFCVRPECQTYGRAR